MVRRFRFWLRLIGFTHPVLSTILFSPVCWWTKIVFSSKPPATRSVVRKALLRNISEGSSTTRQGRASLLVLLFIRFSLVHMCPRVVIIFFLLIELIFMEHQPENKRRYLGRGDLAFDQVSQNPEQFIKPVSPHGYMLMVDGS